MLQEETQAAGTAASRPARRDEEPRREIWFKRRTNPIAAMVELWSFRELMLTLAERDLRVRYKQAVLGVAWSVFMPVLLMLVFSIVFTKFGKVNSHGAPYAVFAYLGLLPWTFFSSSLSAGGLSLVSNTPLLNKVYCPREVFPLGSVIVAAFDAIIASFVLVLLFAVTDYGPRWDVVYAPLYLIVLVAFTVGVTLMTSVIVVYMRDLRIVLPLILQVAIFATPVAYNAGVVARSQSKLIIYSALNPLVPVIDGMRRGVLTGEGPIWSSLIAGSCTTVFVLVFGFWLFKRLETGMADVA
jgi:ABC-2 type transport system permease protein/lipopolysaccharide transport system permease protein